MIDISVEQQTHGYLKGHQLLSSSLKLPREDQDLVDRLSDISGQLRPGETFSPYLTAYPLPSGSHYVLARTWQDLDAPRIGCVLTRSLLIPMSAWEGAASLSPLLQLLTPVRRGEKSSPERLPATAAELDPVIAPYTVELTEALFLESRTPTVVLDTSRAEAATARILSAIWPHMRRTFAVCSYALAPRKIGGREFDLLFAPKSARMRFAEWRGRRVEASGSPPRHRWSVSTASQIFEAADPSLSAVDQLGLLEDAGDGEDGNLRLVLLWNELAAKAEDSPTAVLGMLDIANSQGVKGERARAALVPAAVRAISIGRDQLPTSEAWRFTTTLLGKFSGEAPPLVAQSAEALATNLAAREPLVAFRFLRAEENDDREVPGPVIVGAAQGLAQASDLHGLAPMLESISPHHVLEMIAASPTFARRLASQAELDDISWVEPIARALRNGDPGILSDAADNILPAIGGPALAPVLASILVNASPERLLESVRIVGQATHFEVPALTDVLLSAATTFEHRSQFRDAIAEVDGGGSDSLLLRTLSLDADSLHWLADPKLARGRAQRLLLTLLASQSDRAIAAIGDNVVAIGMLGDILSEDLPSGAEALARVIIVSRPPLTDALIALDRVGQLISPATLKRISATLLERALAEGDVSILRLHQLMGGADIDGGALVRQALPNGAPVDRWATNLLALNSAPTPIRLRVVAHIDLLTERLARGTRDDLGRDAYEAWAALLRDAEQRQLAAHERAAIQTLDFALSHGRLPVGGLVQAAFPPVHARLPRSRSTQNDSLLGLMMTIPLAMFGEIDRAKSARRALVYAFMHSNWPPAQLVLTGLEAGVEQKLLKDVSRDYRGDDYLRAIAHDADGLPKEQRQRVHLALAKFAKTDPWTGDD